MKDNFTFLIELLNKQMSTRNLLRFFSRLLSLNLLYVLLKVFHVNFKLPDTSEPQQIFEFLFQGHYFAPLMIFVMLQFAIHTLTTFLLEASTSKLYNRVSMFLRTMAVTKREYYFFMGFIQRLPFIRIPAKWRLKNFSTFCCELRENFSYERIEMLERLNEYKVTQVKETFKLIVKAMIIVTIFFCMLPQWTFWLYIPFMVFLFGWLIKQYLEFLILLLLPDALTRCYECAVANRDTEPPLVFFNHA